MAKKRANGEGNIRKRKDGRWEGRYTAGYNPETGKRIIKNVLGKTQAECKAKLAAAKATQEKAAAEAEKQRAKEEAAEEKRRQKLEDEERRRAEVRG